MRSSYWIDLYELKRPSSILLLALIVMRVFRTFEDPEFQFRFVKGSIDIRCVNDSASLSVSLSFSKRAEKFKWLFLLSEPALSIENIAFRSGFGALIQFYEAVKREMNCTPRQVRNGANVSESRDALQDCSYVQL